MNNLLLSIISVTKDDPIGIESTIESITKLEKRVLERTEVIIINGGNPLTENANLILKSCKLNFRIVNSFDRSLYHAMNIGIKKANAPLLWILNGGDICWGHSLTTSFYYDLISLSLNNFVSIYQTISSEEHKSNSDFKKSRFVHQGLIYPKTLHGKYGEYVEWKKFTSADFLFFHIVFKDSPQYCVNRNLIIAKIDSPGLSSNISHYIARDIAIFLEDNESRLTLILRIIGTSIAVPTKKLIKSILPKVFIDKLRGSL
jgi:hypothetical protein